MLDDDEIKSIGAFVGTIIAIIFCLIAIFGLEWVDIHLDKWLS